MGQIGLAKCAPPPPAAPYFFASRRFRNVGPVKSPVTSHRSAHPPHRCRPDPRPQPGPQNPENPKATQAQNRKTGQSFVGKDTRRCPPSHPAPTPNPSPNLNTIGGLISEIGGALAAFGNQLAQIGARFEGGHGGASGAAPSSPPQVITFTTMTRAVPGVRDSIPSTNTGNQAREPATLTESPKSKKAKKIKDENAPKRPPSAYILYCMQHRTAYVTSNPKETSNDVTKILADQWMKLDETAKREYLDKANELHAEYKNALQEYEDSRLNSASTSAAASTGNLSIELSGEMETLNDQSQNAFTEGEAPSKEKSKERKKKSKPSTPTTITE